MKALYFLILVPLFFSCGNNKDQSTEIKSVKTIPNQNSKKQFAINFKLANKCASLITSDLDNGQFSAIVKFTNQNGPSIKMPTYLEFSQKSSIYSFYLEAFDLNNNEVDLETTSHPDWFPTDMVLFSKGNILIDTIQSSSIFEFKKIGIYKLRFVFDPNKYFRSEGKISKEIIFSNWDTLTVK